MAFGKSLSDTVNPKQIYRTGLLAHNTEDEKVNNHTIKKQKPTKKHIAGDVMVKALDSHRANHG